MAQAIKHFNGIGTNFGGQYYATIYTCPANTIAIVLPTMLITCTSSGQDAAVSWNSTSTCNHNSDAGGGFGSGNILWKDMTSQNHMMVTHTDKHTVRMSTGINYLTGFGAQFSYSPTYQTQLHYSGRSMLEPHQGHPYSYAFKSGLVAGSNFQGASSNHPLQPMDHHIGTWSMSAGHKLSLSCGPGGAINYSFVIIEEAA